MVNIVSIEQKFPETSKWIRLNFPTLKSRKPKVWKAFLKYSELSEESASLALRNGFSPQILVKDIYPRNAEYSYEVAKDTIIIDEQIMLKFEEEAFDSPKMHRFLESTILHEMCHWGDMKSDGQQQMRKDGRRFEEGEAFEYEAYGDNLDPYWPGRYKTNY